MLSVQNTRALMVQEGIVCSNGLPYHVKYMLSSCSHQVPMWNALAKL